MNRAVFCLALLLGAVILLPFSRLRIDGLVFELPGSYQFLLVFFVILLTGIWHFMRTGFRLPRHRLMQFFLVWICIALVSAGLSADPFLSCKRLILASGPVILLFLLTLDRQFAPMVALRGLVTGLFLIASLSVLWAWAGVAGFWSDPVTLRLSGWSIAGINFSQTTGQRVFTLSGDDYLWMRMAGFFPNPNGLGIVVVFLLALSGFLARRWQRPVQMLMIAGILVSFSRTGLLLLLVTGGYLVLSGHSRLRWLYTGAIALGVLCLPLLVSDQATGILTGILELLGLSSQEFLQLRERGDSLIIAWQALPDYWLTGAGFGLGTETLFDGAPDKALHSVFFNAWIETGIFGMVSLVAMWLYPVWQARHITAPTLRDRLKEPRIVLPAILVGLFAAQVFDLSVTRFHYVHLLFFTFLGLLTAFNRQDAGDNHA